MNKGFKFFSFLCIVLHSLTAVSQVTKFTELLPCTRAATMHGSSDYMVCNATPGGPSTLMRVTNQGAIRWAKQCAPDTFQVMKLMPDNGVLLVGTKQHAIVTLRTDSTGNVIWAKNFNLPGISNGWNYSGNNSSISGFDVAADGSFLVCAQQATASNPTCPFFVFSADPSGNLQWIRAFKSNGIGTVTAGAVRYHSPHSFTGILNVEFTNGSTRVANGIAYRSDSVNPIAWVKRLKGGTTAQGFISAGSNFVLLADSSGTNYTDNIVLLDSAFNPIRTMSFREGADGSFDNIKQTSDGGYIVSGWSISFSNTAMPQATLIKTDANLQEQWTNCYGRVSFFSSSQSRAGDVCETADKGFLVPAGKFLFKTDSLGSIGCEDSSLHLTYTYSGPYLYPSVSGSGGILSDTVTISVSSLSITSTTVSPTNSMECLITRITEYKEPFTLEITPNPCSDRVLLFYDWSEGKAELQVYSVLGKLITTRQLLGNSTELLTSEWVPGVYFLSIRKGNRSLVKKIVKQ